MKKVFIAYDAETFEVHKHPVFTGEIAYDLNQSQEIQIHPELDVREFTSEGELMAAVTDYMREHVGGENEREEITSFVVMPVITFDVTGGNARSPKTRFVKGVQSRK